MSCKSLRAGVSLGAWLSLSSCGAGDYLYTPSTTTLTSSEPARSRSATYPFPPDSPHGNIRLATSGTVAQSSGAPDSVRLRMVIRNGSNERWFLDIREQKLVLAKGKDGRPVVTPTSFPSLPSVIEVLPEQSATVDLSYALPPGSSKGKVIPAFDVVWTVHAGPRTVTTSTRFERLLALAPPLEFRPSG